MIYTILRLQGSEFNHNVYNPPKIYSNNYNKQNNSCMEKRTGKECNKQLVKILEWSDDVYIFFLYICLFPKFSIRKTCELYN